MATVIGARYMGTIWAPRVGQRSAGVMPLRWLDCPKLTLLAEALSWSLSSIDDERADPGRAFGGP